MGRPLVRALVAMGLRVVATTRSPEKQDQIAGDGATPVVVDALDAVALERAVRAASPTHVIHQLTALPAAGPRSEAELEETNRLREHGTRNLLRAAEAAGARRIVVGSFAPLAALARMAPRRRGIGRAAQAVQSMEEQTLTAARRGQIEGIVLRYGLFYGAGAPSTDKMIALVRRRRLPALLNDRGRLPFIYLEDAVAATVAALDHGTSGSVYHIVDDRPASYSALVREIAALTNAPSPIAIPQWLFRVVEPYLARMLGMDLPLSNADARRELEWSPRASSHREGLAAALAEGRGSERHVHPSADVHLRWSEASPRVTRRPPIAEQPERTDVSALHGAAQGMLDESAALGRRVLEPGARRADHQVRPARYSGRPSIFLRAGIRGSPRRSASSGRWSHVAARHQLISAVRSRPSYARSLSPSPAQISIVRDGASGYMAASACASSRRPLTARRYPT